MHDIYWGSHGCSHDVEHEPFTGCRCDCCECPDTTHHKDSCVAWWPHYGDGVTLYYGEDAEKLKTPAVKVHGRV